VFSVQNKVGQLLEIRVASPFTLEDAGALFKQIYRTMPKDRGKSRVIADLRGLRIVDPQIIDMVVGMMRIDNPMVERNAFLLPDSGALVLIQSERMLKELGAESRRAFRNRTDAEKWLGEVLSPEEKLRMRRFLDESFG
jgi:hypothetical protein